MCCTPKQLSLFRVFWSCCPKCPPSLRGARQCLWLALQLLHSTHEPVPGTSLLCLDWINSQVSLSPFSAQLQNETPCIRMECFPDSMSFHAENK